MLDTEARWARTSSSSTSLENFSACNGIQMPKAQTGFDQGGGASLLMLEPFAKARIGSSTLCEALFRPTQG